jgi:hypothetical protein
MSDAPDAQVPEDSEEKPTINETTPKERAAESQNPEPDVSTRRRRLSKKQLLVLIAILVLVAGASSYVLLRKKPQANQQTVQTTETTEPEQTPLTQNEEDILLARFTKPTTGETWLASPKKIDDQHFLKDVDYDDGAEYYEVGSRAGKTIYMSVVSQLGDDIRLYEKGADGKVINVSQPDGDATYNENNDAYLKDTLADTVIIDKSIHYDSLTLPRKLAIEHDYKLLKPTFTSLGDFIRPAEPGATQPNRTVVKTVGLSKIQKQENVYTDTKLTSIGYLLELPIGTRVVLTYEPIEVELKNYQWQRGNSSTDSIRAIARGCGGFYTSVTRSDVLTDSDVREVGKAPSGQKVYELVDTNHALLQKAYDEFHEFASFDKTMPYATISKEDFIKEHGLVLHKDRFGQWLVYTREELRPAYGCAKPVVFI